MNVFPDDIDDDDEDLQDLSKVSFQRTIAEHSYPGRPMDQHTATVGDLLQLFFFFFLLQEMQRTVSAVAFNFLCSVFLQELKVVLLGSSLNWFSIEWRNQGFTFSETHDLRYGIVQKKVVSTVLLKNSGMSIFIHVIELHCHGL